MKNLALRDRLIPWYFVIFFTVIAIVNGVMVTLAVRTHSGLVTDHPYEKGLAYNQVVNASSEQDALGWKAEIVWKDKALSVTLRDSKGHLLKPEKISAHFSRPTQSNMDFDADITQPAEQIHFPTNGVWDARLFVTYQGREYQQSKRIVVE